VRAILPGIVGFLNRNLQRSFANGEQSWSRVRECLTQRVARYYVLRSGSLYIGRGRKQSSLHEMQPLARWHERVQNHCTACARSVRYVARLALVAIDKVRPWYGGLSLRIGGVQSPVTRSMPLCMWMWITEYRHEARALGRVIWRRTESQAAEANRRGPRRVGGPCPSIALPTEPFSWGVLGW
jgi:hypothetical protein